MVQKPSGRAAETYGIKTRDRFAFYLNTSHVILYQKSLISGNLKKRSHVILYQRNG